MFLALGVVKALEHPADVLVSFAVTVLANITEADLERCVEKFLQLRNCAQLCFVRVDHHPWMINLMTIWWTTDPALGSLLGGNTRAVEAHTSLDKAGDTR